MRNFWWSFCNMIRHLPLLTMDLRNSRWINQHREQHDIRPTSSERKNDYSKLPGTWLQYRPQEEARAAGIRNISELRGITRGEPWSYLHRCISFLLTLLRPVYINQKQEICDIIDRLLTERACSRTVRDVPNENKKKVRKRDEKNVTFSRSVILVRNLDFESFRHFPQHDLRIPDKKKKCSCFWKYDISEFQNIRNYHILSGFVIFFAFVRSGL